MTLLSSTDKAKIAATHGDLIQDFPIEVNLVKPNGDTSGPYEVRLVLDYKGNIQKTESSRSSKTAGVLYGPAGMNIFPEDTFASGGVRYKILSVTPSVRSLLIIANFEVLD